MTFALPMVCTRDPERFVILREVCGRCIRVGVVTRSTAVASFVELSADVLYSSIALEAMVVIRFMSRYEALNTTGCELSSILVL